MFSKSDALTFQVIGYTILGFAVLGFSGLIFAIGYLVYNWIF